MHNTILQIFLLRRLAPAPYFHPLFLPLPLGEVFKIYSIPSPFEKVGGLNYEYYTVTDKVIAHDIIVSFYIFSLLKYGRIFGKSFEHDTCGVKESP